MGIITEISNAVSGFFANLIRALDCKCSVDCCRGGCCDIESDCRKANNRKSKSTLTPPTQNIEEFAVKDEEEIPTLVQVSV